MQERSKMPGQNIKVYPSIDKVFEEYSSDSVKDSEEIYSIKTIIESLPRTDRTLITVYADTGSLKETAELLHISVYKAWKEVNRIKEYIIRRIGTPLKSQIDSKVV